MSEILIQNSTMIKERNIKMSDHMNAKEKKPSKKFHLASKLLKQLQYVTQMLICYFIIYRNEDNVNYDMKSN
jgi:hypothetical protein